MGAVDAAVLPLPSTGSVLLFTQGMIYRNGAKMSKSKGNVIAPDELVEQYGADATRLYTLFMGPPEQDAEWNDEAVAGAYRFCERSWRTVLRIAEAAPDSCATSATRRRSTRSRSRLRARRTGRSTR